MSRPDFIARKVRLEHQFDEVRIVLTCNSEYEAMVLYEDMEARAERGQLTISFAPKEIRRCPSS